MSAAVESRVIVCPEWCMVSRGEHLEQLASPSADGEVLHKSAPDGWATVAVTLRVDGVAAPDDDSPNVLGFARDLSTLEEAEGAAHDYAAAAALLGPG